MHVEGSRYLEVPQQEFWEGRCQTILHSMEHALSPQVTLRYLWILGEAYRTQGQVPSGSSQSLQPCLRAGTL